ncbi:hypothetical protein [Clostridium perfringens]|nr:hypothetical protein [Clostridium perfringens]
MVNKSLRKDNKILAKEFKPNLKINRKHVLVVYTERGIHFYNPSDFRISKNQKSNKKILGVDSHEKRACEKKTYTKEG